MGLNDDKIAFTFNGGPLDGHTWTTTFALFRSPRGESIRGKNWGYPTYYSAEGIYVCHGSTYVWYETNEG